MNHSFLAESNMSSPKTRVLLTGSSGTVGYEVLRQLHRDKHVELTVFDVKNKKSARLFKPFASTTKIVFGDITKPEDVMKITPNQDVVIHLAAIIPPVADENPELAYRVNVNGTRLLVESLENVSPNAFLMYSSSISVYGDRVNTPYIRVTDLLNPSIGDEYAKTKIECEKIIQNSKLHWTIFRLSAIMGGHKITKLMFHMPLKTSMEICTPLDTARAFAHGIYKTKALEAKIFNLGGGEACQTSFQHFLERSFGIFGLGKVNFAENSFASRNFHCGYYADGDLLEDIVGFRQDNLEIFFEKTKAGVSIFTKTAAMTFRYFIKKYLQSLSEPLQAVKKKNRPLMERFFGDTASINP